MAANGAYKIITINLWATFKPSFFGIEYFYFHSDVGCNFDSDTRNFTISLSGMYITHG